MILTEQEARARWCPFARVTNVHGDGGGNRWDKSGAPHVGPNGSLCIASECMAWRVIEAPDWVAEFAEHMAAERYIHAIKCHRTGTGSTLKEAKDFMEAVRYGHRPMPQSNPEERGYCGLSGKPE